MKEHKGSDMVSKFTLLFLHTLDKKPRIAYISASDPLDPTSWSGTHYTLYHTLNSFADVIPLGPYQPRTLKFVLGVLHKFLERFTGKRWNYRHSKILSKTYARHFEKKVAQVQPDVLVAPAASAEIAFLNTDVPILYITDGTFKLCMNYHAALSNLAGFSARESDCIEKLALGKSAAILVSSEWCARSVREDYNIISEKIFVHPLTANLPEKDMQISTVRSEIKEWHLLFMASQWKNKGGPIVLEAFRLLKKRISNVNLHLVGCVDQIEDWPDGVVYHGFLRKQVPDELKKLNKIFSQCHLMLLPTRFDCTPVSICEASMYGIPSLVSDTGGVSGHLRHGRNGFLIPFNASAVEWADKIYQVISDPEQYHWLREKSITLYQTEMRREHLAQTLSKIIRNITK